MSRKQSALPGVRCGVDGEPDSKFLAERVGFEPTLEFPLNTLSKRAPSATRPSLRRFREATARQNRSLEPALRFYGDGTPPATCGHYFRKYPELQIQELV